MLSATTPKSRRITSVVREDDRLILRSEYGILVLEPHSDSIVRVISTVRDELSDRDRPGIVHHEPFGEWHYHDERAYVRLVLPKLVVNVTKSTGHISYSDDQGYGLFSECRTSPREFEEFETYRLADVEQETAIVETADGKKELIEEPKKISTGKSFHIRLNFQLGDEAIYGLGQQEKGFASLRGHTLYIHQANRKIAIPMFVSTRRYGILVDTYSPMIFHDDPLGSYIYVEAAPELDYYFIAGDMDAVIRGYRLLTGKASMLPKWAFGYIQSQERYESAEEILSTVEKSRELGIGMDCIVLDWMSWPDGQWGQKSYDETRFPDPKGMIDKLHDDHVHFMISIWPNSAEDTDNHREFAEAHLLLPASGVYDPFKEAGRRMYFDQLARTHFAYGTDAWWCDSSEPYTPEWSHVMRPEESDNYREFCEQAGLRMPYEYCNSFPLYHAMGIYENQRRLSGDREKRVCNLTRSAYTGQQRYGTIMWSGDTDASWETFRDQIAIGLHFSASGLPYWTMDTGAFFVKPGDCWYWNGEYEDPLHNRGYCELYTRWYQYAAFLPVFRAHGTDIRREMWNFEGEFYDALLAANRLRYSLMPYIYSEAGKVWLEDRSLIRWLAFDFPNDRRVWDITDQYMFGESLMVCPVTRPIYYDEAGDEMGSYHKTRQVYLPEGCDWYDYHTGIRYAGGSEIAADAPLDRIPLYVRAGSVIPVREPALSTEEQTGEIRYRSFYDPDTDPTPVYTMYDDAGDGYGYEKGEYTLKEVTI